MAGLVVDVRGLAEAKALLEKVQGRELNNRMRRSLRRGAKVFREKLRDTARSRPDLPRSFAKTRTRAHRNPLGVSVSPSSSLSNIFEVGAKSHEVGGSQLLSNFNSRRRDAAGHRGGFFLARGPVHHPGMAARPFLGQAFDAAKDPAADAMADELFEGLD